MSPQGYSDKLHEGVLHSTLLGIVPESLFRRIDNRGALSHRTRMQSTAKSSDEVQRDRLIRDPCPSSVFRRITDAKTHNRSLP